MENNFESAEIFLINPIEKNYHKVDILSWSLQDYFPFGKPIKLNEIMNIKDEKLIEIQAKILKITNIVKNFLIIIFNIL